MLSRYDELELLALIENELDEAKSAALHDRLAGDSGAAAIVAAMSRDRATLRSLPEPPMPHDLGARVEQALTRPMLIAAWGQDEVEPQPMMAVRPGEFRRRHTAAGRRRRIVRYALAAGLGLMVLGGVWAALSALPVLNPGRGERLVVQSDERTTTETFRLSQRDTKDPDWPPAGSIIHHYTPLPVLEEHLAQGQADIMRSRPASAAEPVAVEFALVVKVGNVGQAEAAIEELLASRGSASAFVQNFSFEEAVALEQQWLARRAVPPSSEPPRAGIGRDHQRLRQVADRALDQIRERDRSAAAGPSRQLAGPRELAASFAQQLEYSNRGATHTVTLRLSELHEFLGGIDAGALPGGMRVLLQPLPEANFWESRPPRETHRGPAQPLDGRRARDGELWISSRAAIREAIEPLESAGGDPLIHLPIVIE